MTATTTIAARAPARPRAIGGIGFDWAFAILSTWFVGGAYLDGWAHNHVSSTLETFFTPWHAVLYLGYFVTSLLLAVAIAINRRRGEPWRMAIPDGYGLSLAGAAIFLAGGVADTLWHTILGIEVSLEQLLSPPHLTLATGGVLMVSGPIRAAWRRGATGRLAQAPLLVGMTLTLALFTFMTQFAHPFTTPQAFEAMRTRVSTDLYVMNADGSAQLRITSGGDAAEPSWSPDGKRIAFSAREAGRAHIEVMNADGTERRRLTEGGSFLPAWSTDGRRIAFLSRRDGSVELYVMDADGSGPRRLTTTGVAELDVAWSPDGSRIAFSAGDGSEDLYTIRADGADLVRLTRDGARNAFASWSLDGKRIAFSAREAGRAQVRVMNADGTGVTTLASPDADFRPAWSPDGAKILFASRRSGNLDLYVMNPDGSDRRNVSRNPGLDEPVGRWSPDGAKILFTARDRPSGELQQARGVLAVLLQAGVLVGLVLLVLRQGSLPFGAFTFVFGAHAALLSVLDDQTQVIAVGVAAGLVADVLARTLRPSPSRPVALRLFALAVPAFFYGTFFATQAALGPIGWSPPLWSGTIFLVGVVGLLASYLVVPPRGAEAPTAHGYVEDRAVS